MFSRQETLESGRNLKPPCGDAGAFYLEDGSVHFLIVILLAGMLPRDTEHGLLVAFPYQPRVQAAVNLLNQPLPEPTPTIPVTHPWKETDLLL